MSEWRNGINIPTAITNYVSAMTGAVAQLVITLDVSKSMLATGLLRNRLERAKQVALKLNGQNAG